jgi:predicted RNA-binding protein with PUA-like domain
MRVPRHVTLEQDSPMAKSYWLMKSEPETYSIDDLERDGRTHWDGVRNYKARNNMRAMKVDDEVLFYHSSASPPGVAGVARVCREAYPDPAQFDNKSDYYDEKSKREDPRWDMVDVEFVAKAKETVGLPQIKAEKALADMELVRYGRLSVQSVKKAEFERVKKMAGL